MLQSSNPPEVSHAPVSQRRHGAVMVLTLNRPQKFNSLDADLFDGLSAGLDAAEKDQDIRCVLLTGAGKAFCAGQDLADPAVAPDLSLALPNKDLSEVIQSRYAPLVRRISHFPMPKVAAVNGIAAGAGANLALNCDLVLAGQQASFVQAFSKIGLIPDSGGTWLLPRLVGRGKALGLALLSEKCSAAQAEQMGLIWAVVPDQHLLDESLAVCEKLAALPTHALVQTRRAMDRAISMTLEEALEQEQELQGLLGFSKDYQEGVRAFAEKRAPLFTKRSQPS